MCAVAGSFDDKRAVKQTRDPNIGLMSLGGENVERMEEIQESVCGKELGLHGDEAHNGAPAMELRY